MLIRVGGDHQPRLEEAENLRAFKLVIEAERAALPQLQAAFGPAGRLESDQYAWVKEDWLRAQSPLRDDAAWREGFGKMLDFARSKGWVSDDGAIRAHVEWAGG